MPEKNKDLNCKANNYAAKISIIYAVVSAVWILVSDMLTTTLFAKKGLFTVFSVIKGWLFVLITASLLYFLIRKKIYSLYLSENKLQNALEELQKTNAELSKTQEKLVVQYKKLAKNQEKIKELAYFDQLTNLPNRNHFMLVLEKAIKEAHFKGQQLALIYIDIDNFSKINNTLGHETGDVVLKEIAQRLKEAVGNNGFVARLTGDEFGIIIYNFLDFNVLNYFIYKIFNSFSMSWEIMEYDFYITPSMGVAIYPSDGQDSVSLLKNADKALKLAKEKGKNTFCFYNVEMDNILQQRLEFESDLRKAIEKDQFVLYYQPIVNLEKMQLCGAEALIRWIHPQKGMIPPMSFIPIAEQTGLISQIGQWVLTKAIWDLKSIREVTNHNFYVSFNASLREFSSANFVDNVLYTIEALKADPTSLGIEITESVAMADPQNTIKSINTFKEKGIKVFLDDFGTGYSSLNYLKQLPIDVVKIDRSFIANMSTDIKEQRIAKSLIDLSHILDLKVVAEGIEDSQQAEILKSFDCDFGQGYLFGKPLPKDQFIELAKRF
ncbi:diguanylate cyclase/phosphodiesterase [Caldicellulosiruptor acetigenus I77R1B]|uniref:Diguanylate cyclase/phosphodiesterase n=1 Tax=Caldicellulosiruptor acetigenus (strain ATCC 700853 / DSM 12137 / I77R1B) TaxID=632335 RepID=E4S6B8_CALA7|nr:EAL domain-containing protein [Caldicellulosiruptor acetigenus]ADQ41676.1 diguanylate cyclase/phosphodiesterase [Caldicellulosiruptor acetigenus I77R1B]